MHQACFSILRWSAWAPGISSHSDWKLWAEGKKEILEDNLEDKHIPPLLNNVPAIQLRRLSNLTKMSLKVALECAAGEKIESVFASRYGEWQQTCQLLDQIANNEEISPAGFSLSVHNTGAGVYSVISQDTSPYVALAAGSNTFKAALIEALSRLENTDKIMLVISEEAIPEIYKNCFPERIIPYALCLLLEKEKKINLSFDNDTNHTKDALSFLKWMLTYDQNT